MYEPSLVITREKLKVLAEIAATAKLPINDFEYTEFQQAITINSLIEYCKSYGIELPFILDLKS